MNYILFPRLVAGKLSHCCLSLTDLSQKSKQIISIWHDFFSIRSIFLTLLLVQGYSAHSQTTLFQPESTQSLALGGSYPLELILDPFLSGELESTYLAGGVYYQNFSQLPELGRQSLLVHTQRSNWLGQLKYQQFGSSTVLQQTVLTASAGFQRGGTWLIGGIQQSAARHIEGRYASGSNYTFNLYGFTRLSEDLLLHFGLKNIFQSRTTIETELQNGSGVRIGVLRKVDEQGLASAQIEHIFQQASRVRLGYQRVFYKRCSVQLGYYSAPGTLTTGTTFRFGKIDVQTYMAHQFISGLQYGLGLQFTR